MQRYQIWYMRPDFFRDGTFGHEVLKRTGKLPNLADLGRTHVYLKDVRADDFDDVYYEMQGEVWSPYGEARSLIESKGLHHTSMTIGDIIVNESGVAFMVDRHGFATLGQVEHTQTYNDATPDQDDLERQRLYEKYGDERLKG